MFAFLTQVRWSPYAVGAGIGILSWFSFLILRKPIGCSTAFAKTSGMIEKIIYDPDVASKAYYQKIGLNIDWQWMLVIGVIAGAFVSALLSGDFRMQWVPGLWLNTFGNTPWLRLSAAVIGGLFLGFGARWADGCTSGHGISGAMQLAVSSWISAIAFFFSGIMMAFLLFHVIGG